MNQAGRIPIGGITDIEGAKLIARQLFQGYDRDKNGMINHQEVAPMMVDAYQSMSKGFNPSNADLETYHKVLDRNNDGRVTLQDIEALAIQYLVGEINTGGGNKFQNVQNSRNVAPSFNDRNPQFKPTHDHKYDVIREIFRNFDNDRIGFIYKDDLQLAVQDVFKQLGHNYIPTMEDFGGYMQNNQFVTDKFLLEDFETICIEIMEKVGI